MTDLSIAFTEQVTSSASKIHMQGTSLSYGGLAGAKETCASDNVEYNEMRVNASNAASQTLFSHRRADMVLADTRRAMPRTEPSTEFNEPPRQQRFETLWEGGSAHP